MPSWGGVRRRVGDKRVLGWIKAFLKAGILAEDGLFRKTLTGTPQGGILSPLLANIALSILDKHFAARWAKLGPYWTRSKHRQAGGVVMRWSCRVVGWAMAGHLRTELVLQALNMAIWQRRPEGVIHHSDQGSQYTSVAFGSRCQELGVRPSMGSVGDAYDNALCESFFATLECELIDRSVFRTRIDARLAIFDFIEGFYNPHRRHSAIDYFSPIEYEKRYNQKSEKEVAENDLLSSSTSRDLVLR